MVRGEDPIEELQKTFSIRKERGKAISGKIRRNIIPCHNHINYSIKKSIEGDIFSLKFFSISFLP